MTPDDVPPSRSGDDPGVSRPDSDETLDATDPAWTGRIGAPIQEGPGTHIGPYRLIETIGEGGYGTVFLAEQKEPVERRVAIKIIKLGMDTQQVVARFEQERQVLAMMDHPNIARVLDAGATQTGRPYFVMDLVEGDPISGYCDRGQLSIPARLELFTQVCHAIQHAHTKGVIHRDIKPSNVLVSTHDGRPHAKVIDFGIAKATSGPLRDKSTVTVHQMVLGTPEYMSPEQAQGSLDIDTRTDVYALGVLLYELVTGTTPFSETELRKLAYEEMRRIICDVDPIRPSARLSQSIETLPGIAARRQTAPRRLGAAVRGDLDWVVMRALEKDRQRRYQTASALEMDVQHVLRGEAVSAAPPSTAYRLKKFVRRNRGAVIAGTTIAAALVVGAFVFAWQARVTEQQRDRAVAAEAEVRKRAGELQEVSQFQARMLAQVDPAKAGLLLTKDVESRYEQALAKAGVGDTARDAQRRAFAAQWSRVNATDAARDLIDRTILTPAVEAIDKEFAGQPLVDATLRQSLAKLYKNLGLYESAFPLQEKALASRRRLLGPERAETLDSLVEMAELFRAQGKFAEAEPLSREAMDTCRRVLGAEHPLTLAATNNLGFLLKTMGRFADAEPYLRDALTTQQRVLGSDHRDTLNSELNLATVLQAGGKIPDAEQALRDCLERSRRALGEDDQLTLNAITTLSDLVMLQGKFAEAEALLRDGSAKCRRLLGEDHPDTIAAINNLGYAIQNQGRLPEAEVFLLEALDKYRRVLGPDHPDTLTAMNNVGILLQDENKMPEAERYLRGAMEGRRRALGADKPHTLDAIGNVGRLLQAEGRLDEASPYLREALAGKRRVLGEEHPSTLVSINGVGALLQAQGNLADAETYYREAMEKCRKVLGAEHPNTLITTINVGTVLQLTNRNEAALKMLGGIEAQARKSFTGAYARWLAKLLTSLGKANAALGTLDVAEADLLEGYALHVSTKGEGHKDTQDCVSAIVSLFAARNRAQPDKGYDAKAGQWRAKLAVAP